MGLQGSVLLGRTAGDVWKQKNIVDLRKEGKTWKNMVLFGVVIFLKRVYDLVGVGALFHFWSVLGGLVDALGCFSTFIKACLRGFISNKHIYFWHFKQPSTRSFAFVLLQDCGVSVLLSVGWVGIFLFVKGILFWMLDCFEGDLDLLSVRLWLVIVFLLFWTYFLQEMTMLREEHTMASGFLCFSQKAKSWYWKPAWTWMDLTSILFSFKTTLVVSFFWSTSFFRCKKTQRENRRKNPRCYEGVNSFASAERLWADEAAFRGPVGVEAKGLVWGLVGRFFFKVKARSLISVI